MDFDILVPLFVSRLEGGPETTHSRLFSMNEDLFGIPQLAFQTITDAADPKQIYDMLRLYGLNKLRIL